MKTSKKATFTLLILIVVGLSMTPVSGLCGFRATYYLVRKTYTTRNGAFDTGQTEIFTLDRQGLKPHPVTPAFLCGTASFPFPPEREKAIRTAFFDALSSYSPPIKDIFVTSATDTRPNGGGLSTQIVVLFLFSPPLTPVSVDDHGNTLRVSFESNVSRLNPVTFPLYFRQPAPSSGIRQILRFFTTGIQIFHPACSPRP